MVVYYVLLVLLALEVVGKILIIGKKRDPITPHDAVVAFVINGFFIIWILHLI